MLTQNGIKQEISFIYLHALVTRLGYSLERTSIDMDSVDATICARAKVIGSRGSVLSPKIDVQLKATERDALEILSHLIYPGRIMMICDRVQWCRKY